MNVSYERLVDLTHQFYDTSPPLEWQGVISYTFLIYNTKHWITYGGNPHGRHVILFGERTRG